MNGNLGQPTAETGVCTDTLTTTAGGGEAIPVLCGDISTQHSK